VATTAAPAERAGESSAADNDTDVALGSANSPAQCQEEERPSRERDDPRWRSAGDRSDDDDCQSSSLQRAGLSLAPSGLARL